MRLNSINNSPDLITLPLGDFVTTNKGTNQYTDRTHVLPPGRWQCSGTAQFDWTAITGYEQWGVLNIGWALGNNDISSAFAICELDPNSVSYFIPIRPFILSSQLPILFFSREFTMNSPSGAGGFGWHRFGSELTYKTNMLYCKRIG